MLPAIAKADLGRHLEAVRTQHQEDLPAGAWWVELSTPRDASQSKRHAIGSVARSLARHRRATPSGHIMPREKAGPCRRTIEARSS